MRTLSFRFPLRFLRGSYGRLALTVGALGCGVALVCAVDLISRAALTAFVDVIDKSAGRAALQVRAGAGGLFDEDVATAVGQVPGVDLAVPVVTATAFTADDAGELLTVYGVDIGQDAAIRMYDARDESGLHIDDALMFLTQPDSIALTRTFMTRRGLTMEDRIDLDTPTGRGRFTVRGALEPQGVARVYGGNLVIMDIFAAQRAFARPGLVNLVDVALKPDADVATVATAVGAILPTGLRVETPTQRKADLNKAMRAFALILRAVGLLGLGVAMLIAFNRVTTAFEANLWQLGTMQAIGAAPAAVWWELIKQALLLGIAGVLVGIPLGVALGHLALPVLAQAMAIANNLAPPEGTLGVAPSSLLLATGTGIAASILAAATPAWRATRRSLAVVLRAQGAEQVVAIPWTGWLSRLVVAVGIATALVLQSTTRSATWGLVATALIATGIILAARPLLVLVGPVLLRGLRWLTGPMAAFVNDAILNAGRRSALTAAMLGLGLATVLWLWMLGRSFEQSVIGTLTEAFRADLVVSSTHIASGFFEAPLDDTVIQDLAAVPGVAAVAGERLIDWHYRENAIIVNAFDPTYFLDPAFGRWPLYGDRAPDVWQAVGRGEAVIASSNFTLHTGTGVGDVISLETPSGAHPLRIAGVTLDFASAGGTLEISRGLYQRLWRDPQITRAFVRTVPSVGHDEVRAAIARAIGRKYRIRILSAGELVDYFADQVRRAFASLYVVAAMVLVVVLLGMADTLAGSVADRTRQIGVLRAVGVQRSHIRRLVVGESVALGLLGVLLAVGGGIALGAVWIVGTFPYLFGWVLETHVPYFPSAMIIVSALAVCVTAALLPARRAARIDPVTALRYE